MATLLEKAQQILKEKNEKLLAENIREGVTIFNVEGTFSVINSEEYIALSNQIEQFEEIKKQLYLAIKEINDEIQPNTAFEEYPNMILATLNKETTGGE